MAARKQVVRSSSSPLAIGPYSQGIRTGKLVFTSGQIPIDPRTGTLVEGGIEEQTRRVLDNLTGVLNQAGASLSGVVKTTVYMTNLADFSAMNAIYGTYFRVDPPARSTVQVAALPLGAAIEIDAVAELP